MSKLGAQIDIVEGVKNVIVEQIVEAYAYRPRLKNGDLVQPTIRIITTDENGYRYSHYLRGEPKPDPDGNIPWAVRLKNHRVRLKEQMACYGLCLNSHTWSMLISLSKKRRLGAFQSKNVFLRVFFRPKTMGKSPTHNVVFHVQRDMMINPLKLNLCRTKHKASFGISD